MGNTLWNIGGIILLEASSKGTNPQFPFFAAAFLLAIIIVVMVGDARTAKKTKENEYDEDDHQNKA